MNIVKDVFPELSIIIPVYNCEKYIKESIQSVLLQKYKNFELILVNDGSTDNTAAIIEDFLKIDNRIRFINNKENYGVSYARECGYNTAKAQYVFFMDGDDLLNPWAIDHMMSNIGGG